MTAEPRLREKKVAILLAEQYHDIEALYPYYRFREEGAEVHFVGGGKESYTGKFGYTQDVHVQAAKARAAQYDAVIVPGGWAPDYMRRVPAMVVFLADANRQGKVIGSICHGGWMLISALAVKGKTATSFSAIRDDMMNAGANWVDREVVVDGNLVTSRKPDDLPAFCREIIRLLVGSPV